MKIRIVCWLVTAISMLLAGMHNAYSQAAEANDGYGDWMVACEVEPPAAKQCAIWQVASTASDGPRLLHVEISFNRPFDGADLLIILPLGISLHTAPSLFIDQKWAMDFKVDYCLADGCYTRTKLTHQQLEQFLRMNGASLHMKSGDGHSIELPLSGAGSRAAFRSTESSTES